MKLLTKAVSAPVRKPASGPKATAVMIMMAEQGLKDDLKHGAAYHGNGRHHCNRHQLASLGLLLIEYQKEGDGGGQQEEKPQQNIGVEDNVIPEGA